MLRPEVRNIFRRAEAYKLTGTPIEHALYQLPRPAIKAYEVGLLHAGGGIPCRPHPAAIYLVFVSSPIDYSETALTKSLNVSRTMLAYSERHNRSIICWTRTFLV